MFSDQLIDQLTQIIIRPHREIYGLDKLGPKKLIIKNSSSDSYIEAYRTESTIVSEGRKLQLSIFQPFYKPISFNPNNRLDYSSQQQLSRSVKSVYQEDGEQNKQATIFLHSNSGSRLEGLEYTKYLLQHNQSVCLFDYSGSGVSEGDFVTMGIKQSHDLSSVIDHLQQKLGVTKFNLWGRSMGAVTAVLYAGTHPEKINRMVLDSPFCSFRQLVKEIVNTKTGLPDFLFGSILSKIQENITHKVSVNLMNIDLEHEMRKRGIHKIPCLFLISKDDKLVKPAHVETLHSLHQGQKKIIYLDGSHNKPRPTQTRQKCAQFLCQNIRSCESYKNLEQKKRHYINVLSRKYSGDYQRDQRDQRDGKNKAISNSVILNDPKKYKQVPYLNYTYSEIQKEDEAMPILNLVKKGRSDLYQSSTAATHREDQSLGKSTISKISLSQLKKQQIDGEKMKQVRHIVPSSALFKKQSTEFKKPRAMAIQYKNKIKQQINKH